MSTAVLAIGAHPDDVELGVGGLLHKLTQQDYGVVILDLSQGELSSRGTVDERIREAADAAKVLGISLRENAGLPDGGIANTAEQQLAVVDVIRRHRPDVLLAPMAPDRHPDHRAAHALCRDANFFSGLTRFETDAEPWRAREVFFYHPYTEVRESPQFVVDISDHFTVKQEALRAHASQFYNPAYDGPETLVSSRAFWHDIEVRAAYWGGRIGAAYGEPLFTEGPVRLDLPWGLEKR